MKWPASVSIVRHGQSAYNLLNKIKKDERSAFGIFESQFKKEYEGANDEAWVSDELRTLAIAARRELNGTFSEGDYATPLTEEGIRQSRETGARLLNEIPMPDVVFVSPYLRTRKTFEHILETCPQLSDVKMVFEERIREQEHGLSTIYNDRRIYLTLNPEQGVLYRRGGDYEYRFLNGENKADVRNRIRSFIDTLIREHSGQNVLLISHHLTLLAFRATMERWDREEFMRVDKEETPVNCGVTLYQGKPLLGRDGKLVLERYNQQLYA
jgi:broad specificity phosphatase PhoE